VYTITEKLYWEYAMVHIDLSVFQFVQFYPARQDKRHMPTHKPHEGEKNICVCLIQYLEPLIVQCSCDSDEVDGRKSPRYLDGKLEMVLRFKCVDVVNKLTMSKLT
jgi:hypothetical protein